MNDEMAENPRLLSLMFETTARKEMSLVEVGELFGDEVTVYAIACASLFRTQRKYKEFFAGPIAHAIECDGIMGPILAKTPINNIILENPVQYTTSPQLYFAPLFAQQKQVPASTSTSTSASASTSASTSAPASAPTTPASLFLCNPAKVDEWSQDRVERIAKDILSRHSVPITQSPEVGAPVFATKDTFMSRIFNPRDPIALHHDGKLDEVLLEILNRAGQDEEHAYCIAGGFISKMINPMTTAEDIKSSDVDIFIYADSDEKQKKIINSLLALIFARNVAYATIRGTVIDIYRINAIKLQIVSSINTSPARIIANFDAGYVMAFWHRGQVFVNPLCVDAFVHRSCKMTLRSVIANRIAKIIKSGFHPHIPEKNHRKIECAYRKSLEEDIATFALKLVAHVINERDSPECVVARITLFDKVTKVYTSNPTSGMRICDKMNLRKDIEHGYSCAKICDADLKAIDISDFPLPNSTETRRLTIAGFPLRLMVSIIGKFKNGASHCDIVLSPQHGELFMQFIKGINEKLASASLNPVEIAMRNSGRNVVLTCIVDDDPHPAASHTRLAFRLHSTGGVLAPIIRFFVRFDKENDRYIIIMHVHNI